MWGYAAGHHGQSPGCISESIVSNIASMRQNHFFSELSKAAASNSVTLARTQ